VPAGWAPYRNGYWGWVEPWGWTWLDDENWGFAPFHYGRWLMIDDRWAWIPGEAADGLAAIYAPALLAFFTDADLCAWVPLGPGEVYVPSYPASLGYFHNINAGYVSDIRSRNRIASERASINAYRNERALTAVPRSVVSGSQPVAAHARPISAARLADARPASGALPVRATGTTAGVSPSVARRLGIANAFAAARAQAHAPGPPIRSVAPTANARLAPPHAVASTAQHAAPSAPTPFARAPALAQPGATHHLPGSPVGQSGAAGGNRGAQSGASPSTNAARPTPPAVARRPEPPGVRPPPSPETAGRTVPHVAPVHPTPPTVVHTAPTPQIHNAAPAPQTIGRAPPPAATVHRAPTPPPVAHRQPSPAVHAAPPRAAIGRAPPPHTAFAAPRAAAGRTACDRGPGTTRLLRYMRRQLPLDQREHTQVVEFVGGRASVNFLRSIQAAVLLAGCRHGSHEG
jgi:hypothetical protein